MPAGVLATVEGIFALRAGAGMRSIRSALIEQWPVILLGSLALIYFALGIIALGLVGVLAVSGGLAIAAVLVLRHRSRIIAALVLLAGALPFGIIARRSVIPPLTAALTLVVGLPLIMTSVPHPPTVHRAVGPSPLARTMSG